MLIASIKVFFALATGVVGGYVHHDLGIQWGFPLMAGYGLGFWLWGYVK